MTIRGVTPELQGTIRSVMTVVGVTHAFIVDLDDSYEIVVVGGDAPAVVSSIWRSLPPGEKVRIVHAKDSTVLALGE